MELVEAKRILLASRSVLAASILRPRNKTGAVHAIAPTQTEKIAAEKVAGVDIDDLDANELLEALAE